MNVRGRKIEEVSNGHWRWWLNPEGHLESGDADADTQWAATSTDVEVRVGRLQDGYALFDSVPVGHSLADELLFASVGVTEIAEKYGPTLQEIAKGAQLGSLPTKEALERSRAYVERPISCSSLRHLEDARGRAREHVGAGGLDRVVGSVAVSPGRVLKTSTQGILLAPFGPRPTLASLVARWVEELTMIESLFREKRPDASVEAGILADALLKLIERDRWSEFLTVIDLTVCAHMDRRMSAAHCPPDFESMMEGVVGSLQDRLAAYLGKKVGRG